MSPPLVVVAAAIVAGDPPALLAAQRAYPAALAGRWELPGGKVDPGETDEAALRRELHEELGVEIRVGGRAGPELDIGEDAVLRTFWADIVSGSPQALEHSALRWVPVTEIDTVDWLPSDLPLMEWIAAELASS